MFGALIGLGSARKIRRKLQVLPSLLGAFNLYLISKELPAFFDVRSGEFHSDYRIDLKSVGFDLRYRCITFWVDHIPSGNRFKMPLENTVDVPLKHEVKPFVS